MSKKLWIFLTILAFLVLGSIIYTFSFPTKKVEEKISQDSFEKIKEIEIMARRFSFEPSEIKVKYGEKIRLKIISLDVTHGLSLPEFGINKTLEPGKETVIKFIANKRGSFDFFCSVYCGEGHSQMRGKLIVE